MPRPLTFLFLSFYLICLFKAIWPMLGWGIGMGLQYFEAYNGDRETIAEKEYEKLVQERK